jgi:hypothetical protein
MLAPVQTLLEAWRTGLANALCKNIMLKILFVTGNRNNLFSILFRFYKSLFLIAIIFYNVLAREMVVEQFSLLGHRQQGKLIHIFNLLFVVIGHRLEQ